MDIARLKQLAGIGENPHFIQMPNPRKEFAQKWWGTMLRYTRTMSQDEIEQESEYAWEASTN